MEDNEFYMFDTVELEIKDFETEGFILDIGGGGEGVIGRLKGKDVVAIDNRKEELEETGDGPLKIVMDARDLKFLDNSFCTATLFFSMMYMKNQEDHRKVLSEACRVLKPGGTLHLWDIDLSQRPHTDKEFYIVGLRYRIGDYEAGTRYGMRWPVDCRNVEYYVQLAREAGFHLLSTERKMHTFYLVFAKQ
jgi:ubiquinone/menaquinone biosynthesis C-methylase UbiE